MKDLFDSLLRDGAAGIQRLVDERRQENVTLEFKAKATPTKGEVEKNDKDNLGAVLSAFANSAGGLLIWGVEARKDADGIDCATALRPIVDIERFQTDVRRLAAEALVPRSDGVTIEPIRVAGAAGYLLVLVERSERRPHQNYFDKRYYKRSGDNSFVMEHYDVEDSFKRLTQPALDVAWTVSKGGIRPEGTSRIYTVRVDVSLINTSNVSARFPYLILDVPPQMLFPHFRPTGFDILPHDEWTLCQGTADVVIHPGLKRLAAIWAFEIAGERISPPGNRWGLLGEALAPRTFNYRCGAEHSHQTTGTFQANSEQILGACPGGARVIG